MEDLQTLLTEQESVWTRMRSCGKPVVLYGMGDGAQKILQRCTQWGIEVADVFASDAFVRGHSFAGHRVLRYAEVCEKHRDFLVVIAFATQRAEVLEQFWRIAQEHETVAPDVPVVEDGTLFTPQYVQEHLTQLEQVYRLLADEHSRGAYAALLNYKISGKLPWLRRAQSTVGEAYTLLSLGKQEAYVDLGAYRGDTIEEFLQYTGGAYSTITALEPDARTFAKLKEHVAALGLTDAQCLQVGAWAKSGQLQFAGRAGRSSALCRGGGNTVAVNAVDSLLGGARASYIKMDVEGAEQGALAGCNETIQRWKPKLCVALYHRNRDIFELPLQVHALNPAYRLYLRHFAYVPGWDTNLYAL